MEHNTKKKAAPFKVTGNWADQSKELRSKFSQLTDADVRLEDGKEEEMLNRVTTRLNKDREEVISLLSNGHGNKPHNPGK